MQSSDIAAPIHLARGVRAVRGFTLIELMVVVAIVAILVAIAYPAYGDAVRKSRRGQAKADLVELMQRAERYHTINNAYDAGAGFWDSVLAADRQSPRGAGVANYLIDAVEEEPNDFALTATPQGGQVADTLCGTLSIDEAGIKDWTGTATEASQCW